MRSSVSDSDLQENAAYALQYEVASREVKVVVHRGWVTLTGEVTDAADKEAAFKAVLNLRGVKGIQNYITIAVAPKPQETTKFVEAVPAARS